MDTTRHITRNHYVALAILATILFVIGGLTGHMSSRQIWDMHVLELMTQQRVLVERSAFLATKFAYSTEQPATLQSLKTSADILQTTQAQLHAASPAASQDAAMQKYIAALQQVLALSPDPSHPQLQWVLAQANGPLTQLLEEQEDIYRRQAHAYHNALVIWIYTLCALALVMLMAIVLVVLKPALIYVAQAQQHALELSRLKGDFLANMSHEIRTPMNGIFGMTELLLDSTLNDKQQHYVRTLQNSADHLLGLINDILDFSKLEAGQMKLDPIHFNLLATIEDVIDLLSPRAREKNLELLLRYLPGTPRFVVADPGRIRQILFNLIGNAIKFTDKGYVLVHVEVLTKDTQPWLKVRVEDTGIGIPEAKVSALFEKFMQVESGSSRARQGTGLGLAISRNLVTLMGGEIKVESTPGKGTVFTWQVPLTNAEGAEMEDAPAETLAHKRILMVDDLAPNRQLFKKILSSAGVECLLAENGEEALSILAYEYESKQPLHGVITDYMMPGMDGLQLAKTIKGDVRFKNLPVIMMTSANEQGLIKDFDAAGISACLGKPVTRQQVFDTISQVLEAAERGQPHSMITSEASDTLAAERMQARNRALAGAHVLLVEDNRVNLEITREILAQFGCKVATAENGQQAIDAVRTHRFDLILMDCQMPGMDGFEAARRIADLKAEGKVTLAPIVALTANALKGDRERCLENGMDDYLSKPVRKANLEAILLKWLQGKREASAPMESKPIPPVVASAPQDGISISQFDAAREMLGNKLGIIVGYYLEDAENYINRIAEAAKSNDPASAVIPAHTLKSTSRQLGAMGLADLAARTEAAARSRMDGAPTEDIAALVPSLRTALGQVRPFFETAAA